MKRVLAITIAFGGLAAVNAAHAKAPLAAGGWQFDHDDFVAGAYVNTVKVCLRADGPLHGKST